MRYKRCTQQNKPEIMIKDDCNAPGTMRFGANGPSQHDADTMPVTEFSPTRNNVVLMYLGRVAKAGALGRRRPLPPSTVDTRAGPENLDRGDEWSFCLTAARMAAG